MNPSTEIASMREAARGLAEGITLRYIDALETASDIDDALLREAEAENERLREALREVEAELRFRASLTNPVGQIDPPYTAHSLLTMADQCSEALSHAGVTEEEF